MCVIVERINKLKCTDVFGQSKGKIKRKRRKISNMQNKLKLKGAGGLVEDEDAETTMMMGRRRRRLKGRGVRLNDC